ncbi:MAG: tryptophan synthase subunit alpha [Candidatus Omnitrophica bacterium]|nr:tryptophan synthase subunit alpha [Candidatus Omnitrophota bacterium]
MLKDSSKKAFIAYITAGDPDLALTGKLVLLLERSGADIVELGIPFSDPIADGPTIQAASYRALSKKVNLIKIFALVEKLRKETEIPLVFMTYYNPILKYGLGKFFESCRRTGVDGVIVPDLPVEESGELVRLGKKTGIRTIFLVAPTSTKDRIRHIVKRSSGFVYYVSSTGVTGTRRSLPADIVKKTRLIRSMTAKPVAVGFGVSDIKQAAAVSRIADGVIVGSAIVKIIGKGGGRLIDVKRFAAGLAEAIHGRK